MAFTELKSFFRLAEECYDYRAEEFTLFYKSLSPGLKSFIEEEEFCAKMAEIKNNTSGFQSFRKRFFGWFNMFRIVKYLNYVHSGMYDKKSVLVSATDLLEVRGIRLLSDDPVALLHYYRSLELDN